MVFDRNVLLIDFLLIQTLAYMVVLSQILFANYF